MIGLVLTLYSLLYFANVLHTIEEGKTWVLLVAGSNGWQNYRHQSDICHAYQIVRSHGIHPENIIVMMYDDIAFNKLNPTPGVLINKPNGPNVYKGIKPDYTGRNVRPDIFIEILEGRNPGVGSQKVIDSGPHDRIFVYFADHGAPGILGFNSHVLQANELIEAIERMHQRKRFDKMVFYVEACEAGSMFKNILPKYIDVYAMTATNSRRPSYACYYSEKLETYLGDVFSVNWMEDSDVENLHKESIKKQFHIVKNETKRSKVSQYGNMSISHLPLAEIQGKQVIVSSNFAPREAPEDYLSSREVNMDIIKKTGNSMLIEYTRAKRHFLKGTIYEILRGIRGINDSVQKNLTSTKTTFYKTNQTCYFRSLQALNKHCFNLGYHEYALKFLYIFVNVCSLQSPDLRDIVTSIERQCRYYDNYLDKII